MFAVEQGGFSNVDALTKITCFFLQPLGYYYCTLTKQELTTTGEREGESLAKKVYYLGPLLPGGSIDLATGLGSLGLFGRRGV